MGRILLEEERQMPLELNHRLSKAALLLFVGTGCVRADLLFVTSTNPANGAIVQPFTMITVDVNQAVDPTTVTAGSLTINGVGADFVSIDVTGTVLTYTFNSSPTPAGD